MKKILVAVDGSERQKLVVDAAVGLARRTGAKVVLFRAVGLPHDLPKRALEMAPDDIVEFLEQRAKADLEEEEERIPSELRAGVKVLTGTPWPSIERAANEEDVDLIVVGSHGYSGLDRVLGTTAAKVVNHADRSVLVVRAPERLA